MTSQRAAATATATGTKHPETHTHRHTQTGWTEGKHDFSLTPTVTWIGPTSSLRSCRLTQGCRLRSAGQCVSARHWRNGGGVGAGSSSGSCGAGTGGGGAAAVARGRVCGTGLGAGWAQIACVHTRPTRLRPPADLLPLAPAPWRRPTQPRLAFRARSLLADMAPPLPSPHGWCRDGIRSPLHAIPGGPSAVHIAAARSPAASANQ